MTSELCSVCVKAVAMILMKFWIVLIVGAVWAAASEESNLPWRRYLKPANVPRNQEPRSADNTFLPGPNGQLCILDDRDIHDPTYEHRDEHGRLCCCSICKPGYYVREFCQCDEGEEMPSPGKDTECALVSIGLQYMDEHNNCTQPYECSARCNAHQHKVSDCTRRVDLRCKCDDGWFNPDPFDDGNIPKTCRPKPTCPAGEEPRQRDYAGLIDFICKPCRSGHFKAEGGNWKSCEPHRSCRTHRGSATADNVCLNDGVADLQTKTHEPTVKEQTTEPDAVTTPSPEYQSYATDKPTRTPEPKTSESTPLADEVSETPAPVKHVDTKTKTFEPDHRLLVVVLSFAACLVIGVLVCFGSFYFKSKKIYPTPVGNPPNQKPDEA